MNRPLSAPERPRSDPQGSTNPPHTSPRDGPSSTHRSAASETSAKLSQIRAALGRSRGTVSASLGADSRASASTGRRFWGLGSQICWRRVHESGAELGYRRGSDGPVIDVAHLRMVLKGKSAGARAGGKHPAVRRCPASGHERRPAGGPALWIRLAPGGPARQHVRAPCGSPRPGQ